MEEEKITIKYLRDFILDDSITTEDTILVHPRDFDEIIIEYRKTYEEPIRIPFILLDVLI